MPINPCKLSARNNCHKNAKCIYSDLPGRAECECFPKSQFKGDGFTCEAINNCLTNNGNCSKDANCEMTGPGAHECHCKVGYSGNGRRTSRLVLCRYTLTVTVWFVYTCPLVGLGLAQ